MAIPMNAMAMLRRSLWISHPFEIWTGNISGLKQQCKFCYLSPPLPLG
jgi:hypothetical protein